MESSKQFNAGTRDQIIRDLAFLDEHDEFDGVAQLIAQRRQRVEHGSPAQINDAHTFEKIISAIGRLESRAELDAVFAAAKTRSTALRQQTALVNKATLSAGTRVMTQGLKPKYLSGINGQVINAPARRPGDITIEVDEAVRHLLARYGDPLTGHLEVPASCLRKMET